jgi:hypothetical protein
MYDEHDRSNLKWFVNGQMDGIGVRPRFCD